MKKKAGGKRKGAGRKALPLSEKKSVLKVYVKNERIDKLGGKELLEQSILDFVLGL